LIEEETQELIQAVIARRPANKRDLLIESFFIMFIELSSVKN
jgi:hypothetical protein